MPKLTQSEFLNYAFKEALHREELQGIYYTHLAKTIADTRLKIIFQDFARTNCEHLKQLELEMNNLNIKNS